MKKFFSKLRNILCIFAALAGVLFISSAAVAQSLPDLTVTNATYTPANPNTSDEIILSITVRNQGKAIAENIFVSIFVDNEEFDYYFIPDLEPGESSTDEIELWDLTAGRRTIRVEIDPDNEISESNKKNNIHTFYMTVAQGPQPDLVITSATIEPPNPSATDQIILNITVKNQGAAPSEETELDVYVDGDLFDTCYIFDLDVGETQTEDVNLWYLPAGNHAIWIAVDPDNIVKESNENNNSYNLAMNVNFGFFNTKISGAIKDLETQKPVNGIIVQLDGGAFQTYTNAKGEFSIYGAAPGMHKLQVWGFAYNFQQFDIYVFDDKDTAIAEIAMTKLDGTVVGRIVDSQTGEPLAAATAQLDGGGVWRTLTDEQGYFMFLGVTPGAHTLQAWGYAYNFQEQPINVKETGATDVGSRGFTIIPDTIRGQIIDAGTGRPIMNAHVQFDGGGLGKETKTNITGRFILVNVPAGARQLQTWGWAYQFKQIDVAQNAGAATDAGQIGINPVGGTVNGRLLDAVNGLSVYNAVAQLDGGNKASCLTNSLLNGDFIMYDVTGGTHTFQTWGYAYRFLQQEITATEGNNLNLGDILLTPDPNTFNGRALDAGTRLPISGATVILTGNGQNISTTSFPDGRFVLLNVPQGNYDITVEAPAHSLAHLKAAHPGNNINAEIGDVLLP